MTTLQEGVEAMTHADAHFIKRNKGEWFESWAVLDAPLPIPCH